ncbi:unnamed protein product [Staurois parvus]|uniref:Uncharacterized protein n=1 Tax=Staurois parvus TaxID=386267 RepID=A0ABN9EN20_9NEOB|nr:unnamed protein product [Staurois parvus]
MRALPASISGSWPGLPPCKLGHTAPDQCAYSEAPPCPSKTPPTHS